MEEGRIMEEQRKARVERGQKDHGPHGGGKGLEFIQNGIDSHWKVLKDILCLTVSKKTTLDALQNGSQGNALVCSGYCNKVPQTGWLLNKYNLSLICGGQEVQDQDIG
jgi:hypothetical protein